MTINRNSPADAPSTICPHCGRDEGIPHPFERREVMDAGGECPTCHRDVCRRCAGGAC